MISLARLGRGRQKYGFRWPFVVLARTAGAMLNSTGFALRRWRIGATTRGSLAGDVRFEPGVRVEPGGELHLGRGVFVGTRSFLELTNSEGPSLRIGDGVWISHDCHIQVNAGVEIGRGTLIGEFVSIRDTSHVYRDPEIPISRQGDVSAPIVIGEDVWIGRGSVILSSKGGTRLGKGCVVAANSRVSGVFEPGSVIGSPPSVVLGRRGA